MVEARQIGDGGPAFPYNPGWVPSGCGGMSLRDWFAGQYLSGVGGRAIAGETPLLWAHDAYQFAEAMLTARKEG